MAREHAYITSVRSPRLARLGPDLLAFVSVALALHPPRVKMSLYARVLLLVYERQIGRNLSTRTGRFT